MIYERWDVVVVPFPFTDVPVVKRRPALVLSNSQFQNDHHHVVCGMITSAAHSDWPSDVPLSSYEEAGLKRPCTFRCKLFTIQADLILSRVGVLSPRDQANIAAVMAELLPH